MRRDATAHAARSLLVALSIAVALGGAGAVLVSWAVVRRATIEGFLASNPPSATIRTDSVDAAALERIRAVPGVRDAQARRTTVLAIQVQGTWRNAMLFASEDPAGVRIGSLERVNGQWPPPDGAIAIEASSVAFSGTATGDSVLILAPDSSTHVTGVAGIVRDVGLAPGWMEHVVYAWTSTRTLAALRIPAVPNEVQLVVTDLDPTRSDVRRVAEAAARVLLESGRPVHDVDVPEPGQHIHAAQMDSMLMTQGAFGILALVVGAFLIVNLLAAMLTSQGREIAIMKTLGADLRDLTRMYLVFAAFVGAVSVAIALPASIAFGRRYAALRGEMLNFDVAAYAIPWWAIALIIVAGLLLPVAAAWFPVRRALGSTVSAALRDHGITHDGGDRPEPALARAGGWSRVFVLSLRNAFRRRQRMTLTMLTLTSGGAVFVAAGNLRRAVVGSMDVIYGSQRYDFTARLESRHAADTLERVVRGVSGVDAAEAWTGARASLAGESLVPDVIPLVGVPAGTRLLQIDMMEGSRPDSTRSLIVSRALQREVPSLTTGRRVTLDIGETRNEWTVAGVFEGGPSPQAYTTIASLAAAGVDTRASSVVVSTPMEGLASRVELIQRVRAALDQAGFTVSRTQLLDEARRVTEDHLLMVVQFLGVMGWVMILVGGMGLASTMGLAVLERTREIGVMRAIGARHGTLMTLIQVEGLVIALIAWAVAIPLSLPFSLALSDAFGRIMFRVPIVWIPDAGSVWRWLGVVLAVSLVACSWPALRATRQTIARALACE